MRDTIGKIMLREKMNQGFAVASERHEANAKVGNELAFIY
jgi:hypothetical protein